MPVLNFKAQFANAVENGSKRQSIRPVRKNAINVGDMIYLYTGQRTKACRFLGTAKCTETFSIAIKQERGKLPIVIIANSIESVAEIAKKDGFNSVEDFLAFFKNQYGNEFFGLVIRWSKISKQK